RGSARHGRPQASHSAGGSWRVRADHRSGREAGCEGPHQRLHARTEHGREDSLMAGLMGAVEKKGGLKKAADSKHDPADLSAGGGAGVKDGGPAGGPAGDPAARFASGTGGGNASDSDGDSASKSAAHNASEKAGDPAVGTAREGDSLAADVSASEKDSEN